jgi:hypothetical protein
LAFLCVTEEQRENVVSSRLTVHFCEYIFVKFISLPLICDIVMNIKEMRTVLPV